MGCFVQSLAPLTTWGCFVQSLSPLTTWEFVGSGHQKGQNVVSEAHFGNLEAKATKTFKLRLEAHFGLVQAQDIKNDQKATG